MTATLRRSLLAATRPLGPSDLMREHRLSYHQACRELEDLESDRLLGSAMVNGLRVWSPALQVDEERVRHLRQVQGKALRLIAPQPPSQPQGRPLPARLARKARQHLAEKHPGPLSKCARCRR